MLPLLTLVLAQNNQLVPPGPAGGGGGLADLGIVMTVILGDGVDVYRNGRISFLNRPAADCGNLPTTRAIAICRHGRKSAKLRAWSRCPSRPRD